MTQRLSEVMSCLSCVSLCHFALCYSFMRCHVDFYYLMQYCVALRYVQENPAVRNFK